MEMSRDAGSIPAASTLSHLQQKLQVAFFIGLATIKCAACYGASVDKKRFILIIIAFPF